MQAGKSPVQQKFTQPRKTEEKKPKYPRYHNDSLRLIISDLKLENSILRKKLENAERMYKLLEKEDLDYKMNLFTIREMDVLGDEYFINNPDNIEVEEPKN